MDRIIKTRGRICEDPHCDTPHGPWRIIVGDHVVEIADGGARLDPANILLRCQACHNRKTAKGRATRQLRRW